jgi:DNA modification methylase
MKFMNFIAIFAFMNYALKNRELNLFPDDLKVIQDYSSTFVDNMILPVHRWYRFTAGFSAVWVNQLLKKEKGNKRTRIIDPFAGSGTVLIESEFENMEAIGIEAHPYIYRIAKAKLNWYFDPEKFKRASLFFLQQAKKRASSEFEYPKLITTCFPAEILKKLDALKQTFFSTETEEELKDFFWFLITSILRITSPVGTAQWQYIQPGKSKSKVIDPFIAFESKVYEMYSDMRNIQNNVPLFKKAKIFNEDARAIESISDGWGDLVITSPPYANNYDYADAMRLEMTFWGDIKGWGDLQDNVRNKLVRACTQHVSKLNGQIDEIISSSELNPIKSELVNVFEALKIERLKHGGKKNYHFMIAAYFKDLSDVFLSLRRVTNNNSLLCFVIGDSAPYGIHVPVEKWLGELALGAGFSGYSFEKLRDRNIKWKNRKHRVPLHEGRLWIKG